MEDNAEAAGTPAPTLPIVSYEGEVIPTTKKKKKSEPRVWRKLGDKLVPSGKSQEAPLLDNKVYVVCFHPEIGLYLEEVCDRFEMPAKLYDVEDRFVKRVVKTWNSTDGNLGLLLNGIKGTGKTLTAKMICNDTNLPVVMVVNPYDGVPEFVGMIWQACVVLIDEYEKIYKSTDTMLTAMDGIFTGPHRKMFILTTNELGVSTYLVSRPGRIRYLKQFGDLSIDTIKEITDDMLADNVYHLKEEVIKYLSGLTMLTIDIVRAVIQEVNIHEEEPTEFHAIFNVKRGDDTYNITTVKFNGISSTRYYVTFSPEVEEIITLENIERYLDSNVYIQGAYIGELYAIDPAKRILVTSHRDTFQMHRFNITGSLHRNFRNYSDEDGVALSSMVQTNAVSDGTNFNTLEMKEFTEWCALKDPTQVPCPVAICKLGLANEMFKAGLVPNPANNLKSAKKAKEITVARKSRPRRISADGEMPTVQFVGYNVTQDAVDKLNEIVEGFTIPPTSLSDMSSGIEEIGPGDEPSTDLSEL